MTCYALVMPVSLSSCVIVLTNGGIEVRPNTSFND